MDANAMGQGINNSERDWRPSFQTFTQMIDFEIVFWSNKGVLGADYTLKSGCGAVRLKTSLCSLLLCLWSIISLIIVVNGSEQDHCVNS